MLEHYVLFQPKPDADSRLEQALESFSEAIRDESSILSEISWGRNTNPSGLDRGFSYGCFARIAPGRFQNYWDHPAHQELLKQLDELCADRFAMDYETTDVSAVTAQP